MRWQQIMEGQPRRLADPGVAAWLDAARARPDAGSLYLHGSNHQFDGFHQPKTEWGHLIFSSKLVGEDHGGALQAEYYGHTLYLLRIAGIRRFDPQNDPQAHSILATALECEHRADWSEDGERRIYRGVWDYENKLRQGRIDYQDCHLVIPPAVAAGYNFFRIYEMAMRGYSYGCADASMLSIVDRYPAA